MDLRWINGAVAGLALGLLSMAGTTREARLTAPDARLAALENRSRAPRTTRVPCSS